MGAVLRGGLTSRGCGQAPGNTTGSRLTAENKTLTCGFGSALGGTRTPNLLIRSQMLYPLSYERWMPG